MLAHLFVRKQVVDSISLIHKYSIITRLKLEVSVLKTYVYYYMVRAPIHCPSQGLPPGRRFQIRLDPINAVGTDLDNRNDATVDVITHTS